MDRITVKNNDFKLFMNEKYKLFDMYGENYMTKVPEIYDRLVAILNSDNYFTELIEKRINDKEHERTLLLNLKFYLLMNLFDFSEEEIEDFEKKDNIDEITDESVVNRIKGVLGKHEQAKYLDLCFAIVYRLFINIVNKILQSYVSEKEPALIDCYGVKDIPQADFITERYKQYLVSLNVDATPTTPSISEDGMAIIKQGDLFHGTKYSEQVIESIATKGLVSGQLLGIAEDGETYLCIDFFKADKDSTPDEVCHSGKSYTDVKDKIVFVISHADVEGTDALIPEVTKYDAYNETTDEGKKAREIVNTKCLPLTYDTGAAILIGIPPCMISAVIVNSDIEMDPQKIEFIASNFPKATIISRTSGLVLRSPSTKFKM